MKLEHFKQWGENEHNNSHSSHFHRKGTGVFNNINNGSFPLSVTVSHVSEANKAPGTDLISLFFTCYGMTNMQDTH